MKAISLWQPHASLVPLGKSHETRHWATSYRGPIAIHAAKRWTREQLDLCLTEPFKKVLALAFRKNAAGDFCFDEMIKRRLPFGAIVATATLRYIVPTDHCYTDEGLLTVKRGHYVKPLDYMFGNYEPGRFAWQFADIKALAEPIPFVGRQGLFDVPDDLLSIAYTKVPTLFTQDHSR